MRAACPKDKLNFKIFEALYWFYNSIFHFLMKVARVMLIKATGNPLSQALIGRDAQAVSVKRRLLTADCRLRTRGKMQTEFKMQTAD